jgi:hypothetical protein
MAAGQLGGTLHPTHLLPDKARELAANASFGQAIQSWNKHEYKEAVELFRAPRSSISRQPLGCGGPAPHRL